MIGSSTASLVPVVYHHVLLTHTHQAQSPSYTACLAFSPNCKAGKSVFRFEL